MERKFKLHNHWIGENSSCYIIAEMSANHGGDFNRAVEIIHQAKEAGADCIKIQTYTADTLTIDSDKEFFQLKEGTWKGENLYELYQKAYTPWEWQERLKLEAEKIGLDFFSTAYDKTAVDFLENLNIEFYKIASFEVTDIPLIKYIASKGKPIIMSIGMATLGEIEEAVNAVKSQNNEELILLKCSSAYPAITEDMNLKTIKNIQETFGVPVGLSDHSSGFIAATTAVAMGANVIEKHLCLSRSIETPDSVFSMEPHEFKEMVKNIRLTEKAIGKVDYGVSELEKISMENRKSIYIVKDIKKGERFSEENIRIIRPAQGLAPKYFENVLGKYANSDIEKGSPLKWNMILDNTI